MVTWNIPINITWSIITIQIEVAIIHTIISITSRFSNLPEYQVKYTTQNISLLKIIFS